MFPGAISNCKKYPAIVDTLNNSKASVDSRLRPQRPSARVVSSTKKRRNQYDAAGALACGQQRNETSLAATVWTCLQTVHFVKIWHHPKPARGTLGSRVVSALDSGAQGPGLKSQPRRCRVTVLGKLFTPIVPLFTKHQNW